MRLLFISSFYLFPETRYGGSKRLYYFAREWSRRAHLTLINMDSCAEWAGGDERHPEFEDFLLVPGQKGAGWRERYLEGHEDFRAVLEANRGRIGKFLAGRHFDAVLLAFPFSLPFLDGYLDKVNAPVTYLEDDLSFERYRSEAGTARGPLAKAAKLIRMKQALSFYRPRLARVAKFVGISRQELDAVARHFPRPKRFLATYGLPIGEFPFLPAPSGGPVLGFIGNYGHPPNLDVLRWLADDLAATIRARCPGIRFAIAGKGIPEWARDAFRNQPDVRLLENVPDLKDFYAGISAFLNPIRTGRGMRTKLVEAAAYGRPIVTTSLGAEGLEDLEMRIADGSEGLARACADLLREPDPSDAVRRNRATVESHYSLEKVAAELLAFLEPS
ncbi:MAG: glycosyltransferase family 4 protein [Fibrobacteres bacterium]|nr:glycosyltransferase family 4 protein [Fibrobacterota bacterium]